MLTEEKDHLKKEIDHALVALDVIEETKREAFFNRYIAEKLNRSEKTFLDAFAEKIVSGFLAKKTPSAHLNIRRKFTTLTAMERVVNITQGSITEIQLRGVEVPSLDEIKKIKKNANSFMETLGEIYKSEDWEESRRISEICSANSANRITVDEMIYLKSF